MSLKNVIACIKNNKHFLITSHINLEGDALGSELAFYRLLKKMGKSAVIINEDRRPPQYEFLPGINNIKKFRDNLKGLKLDCFVALDCSELKRCGRVYKINIDNKPILNIDHHVSNKKFGNINWIDPRASSCAEMIYALYKKLRISLDKDSATPLYAGILTDTGSFRYTNTSSFTHSAAAELLKYKINIQQIYRYVYEDIPFQDLKLLTKILATVKCQFHGQVAWVKLGGDLLRKRMSIEPSEYILNFSRAIKGVKVAVLFKENLGKRDEVSINLRSQGSPDVNKIARCFGGGGHKTASGATIKGNIDEVRRRVLAKIKETLKRNRDVPS